MDDLVIQLADRIYGSLATPFTLGLQKALREGDWAAICAARVEPSHDNSTAYLCEAAAADLLRKYPAFPLYSDKQLQRAAREAFRQSEQTCSVTNSRLSPLLLDALAYGEDVHRFLGRARRWIKDVLGPLPRDLQGRFGPGATYGDKGHLTTIPDKMSSDSTVTSDARSFLPLFYQTAWGRVHASRGREIPTVKGNRFATVPKDSAKLRGIAIEPSVNLFYQLGVGREIRARLKLKGIDLSDGQRAHRLAACRASADGSLATIDLSNASDTVSINLVELLLPRSWFELLSALRSRFTQVDGRWHYLEKFSSMGNGYTFELETLLFCSICYAAAPTHKVGADILVYGDDIIVPTERASDVVSALRFFGMTPNPRKTFLDGPFRESCGGDFFAGKPVRPFYLKSELNEPHQIIAALNGLRRLMSQDSVLEFRLARVWLWLLSRLPHQLRWCRGPESLGDIVIHDDVSRWTIRVKNSIRYLRCYKPARFRRVRLDHFAPPVLYAAVLYGALDTDNRGRVTSVTPRDAVEGYRLGYVPYS